MRTRLHRQGTNQYEVKPREDWKIILAAYLWIVLAMMLIALYFQYIGSEKAYAQMLELTISPLAQEPDQYGLRPLTPEEEQDWEGMKRMAQKVAPLYEIPVKVIIAQMALESGRGTSNFCMERNNCFGIAAYDSNPDAAWWFVNKEQGMIEYMRIIRDNFPEAYAQRANPDRMIELLVDNSQGKKYATDPSYVTKLRSLAEWSMY